VQVTMARLCSLNQRFRDFSPPLRTIFIVCIVCISSLWIKRLKGTPQLSDGKRKSQWFSQRSARHSPGVSIDTQCIILKFTRNAGSQMSRAPMVGTPNDEGNVASDNGRDATRSEGTDDCLLQCYNFNVFNRIFSAAVHPSMRNYKCLNDACMIYDTTLELLGDVLLVASWWESSGTFSTMHSLMMAASIALAADDPWCSGGMTTYRNSASGSWTWDCFCDPER